MSNTIYLTLNGAKQGFISAECCSEGSVGDKVQSAHQDQIMVYSLTHLLSRDQDVNHHEIVITKPVDKSSPLLLKAIADYELMTTCNFVLYRESKDGGMEKYYTIKLENARITRGGIITSPPAEGKEMKIQEELAFIYESITWEHMLTGTSAKGVWAEAASNM